MDLFAFSELVGSGLPLFTPRGTVLREKLTAFAEQLRRETGFERVSIPHITKTDLYKVSGHWDKFGDELFLSNSQQTSDVFALKPMNCPHHNQIYASNPRSYKDLPIKYFETTTVLPRRKKPVSSAGLAEYGLSLKMIAMPMFGKTKSPKLSGNWSGTSMPSTPMNSICRSRPV